MTIEGITGKVGLEKGYLNGPELSDGTKIRLPVLSVNGKVPGKTLFLISTMHGQEITGIEIIRRICREVLNPDLLTGRVIAIPIGNPLAYFSSTYHTVRYDYQDLNRVFPGDPGGSTTLRLADAIWKVASQCDMLIDLHCIPRAMGNGFSVVRPFGTDEVNERCFEMARAFGLTICVSPQGRVEEKNLNPGLQAYAVSHGIPALLTELNDWRRISEATVAAGVRGVMNVLRKFSMLEGNLDEQPNVVVKGPLYRTTVMANRGGIMHPLVGLGDRVKQGDLLVKILDPFGDEVERIIAPYDCYICAFPQLENQAVATGDYVVGLAREKPLSKDD